MKYTFYLAVFIASMIMMVTAAPHTKKVCQVMKDPHANAVCKEYCGKSGYLLGSCGKSGICICNKKKPAKKVTKKTTAKKH